MTRHCSPPPDPVPQSTYHGPRMYAVTIPGGDGREPYRRCTLWELRAAIREIMAAWDERDDIYIEREPWIPLRILAGVAVPCEPKRLHLAGPTEPKAKRRRKPAEIAQGTLF